MNNTSKNYQLDENLIAIKCAHCRIYFYGNAMRYQCKKCSDKHAADWAQLTEQQKLNLLAALKRDVIGFTIKE